MFSTLNRFAKFTYDFFDAGLKYSTSYPNKLFNLIKYWFLGDLVELIQNKTILRNDNSEIDFKIGPVFYRYSFLAIKKKQTPPEIYKDQQRLIMNIPEPNARNVYSIFNRLTSSTFFLSMNSKSAYAMHQHWAMHLSKIKIFDEKIPELFKQLFAELREKNDRNKPVAPIITKHILTLFSKVLFGFEVNDDLRDILEKVELTVSQINSFLPRSLQMLQPNFRKTKLEFDSHARLVLREQIIKLKNNICSIRKNYLIEVLLNKCKSTQAIQNLSEDEISNLTKDPDIRLCISGLLAVFNLTKTINTALNLFYAQPSFLNEHLAKLLAELNQHKDEPNNKKIILDKSKMPFLHSFYLTVLESYPPMTNICRYTKIGLNTDNCKIPPRSTILFEMKMDDFNLKPGRFITDGQLNNEARLAEKNLLAFGSGKLMCPAQKISELIFKHFIVQFGLNVKSMGFFYIIFMDELYPSNNTRTKSL